LTNTVHTARAAASPQRSPLDGLAPAQREKNAPTQAAPDTAHKEEWYDRMAGVIVAVAGLLVLLGIMVVAIVELPGGTQKGTNIVALASAAFGVIGAVVGAFFGVRAANRAVNKMSARTGNDPDG
jgi:hypothetical protein